MGNVTDYLVKSTIPQYKMEAEKNTYTLSGSLKRYFASGQFADLTIRADGEVFKVHKVAVCGQSEYFSRMFSGEWEETVNNEVELKEVEPDAVATIIHFLYGFDYDSSGSSGARISPMLFDAQIYGLTEKYGIPSLKERVKEKFANSVRACWDMDDFPLVIEEVYTTTASADRGLRDLITGTCHEHFSELLQKEGFIRALESCIYFAADLAKQGSQPLPKYRCPNCSKEWPLSAAMQTV
ncbi:uncharacterized protein GIQ15_01950 [Arthroderma uncinatum]|uniref:uncharacterized protein n=1 Tax=Arthroderma uncinatum TaxID=74035 RepID=UPI00144A765C|nr:uncharacterized protein GIQ15_01950 [Arthroderma uncinatum]KAF3492433.1 hypothetical protein GIQ15_01950 [Arthroderma uncinatum]